jgi:thiol-disulfide isomerase/thioredoxin
MKKQLIYFIYILAISSSTTAQTIDLEFPYFAGKTYEFTIFQGDKRITLKSDAIPQSGKVQLTIPENYKGYKGMAQWYLTNSATGGGLDLIINNEDFSVVCFDSIPTAESIVYKNTIENLSDKATYDKQQQLFQRHDALLATKRAYDKESELYKLASTEYNSLIKQYEALTKSLSASTLYAAKFRQIVNLTMGIGTIITLDEKEKANNINDFITNELDFEVLYTSNHWGGIINNWVQLQTMVVKDDTKLIADAITILNRIKTDAVYTDFVINLTRELTKVGKDDVLFALILPVKNSKKLLNYDGVLNIYKQDLSGKAPDVIFKNTTGTKIIKTTELNSKYTLLLFYKSGCGPCEDTIESLKSNYTKLVANGLKIIALSSDTDATEFKTTAVSFPWKDTFCDLDGVNSVNFKNYAVIGTPTMYLLDSKGKILKKLATVEELLTQL